MKSWTSAALMLACGLLGQGCTTAGQSAAVATPPLVIERFPSQAPYCPALPPPQGKTVRIKAGDVGELAWAAKTSDPGTTLLLEDGSYGMGGGQTIEVEVPGLVIRSLSGRRDAVVIEGGYNNLTINVSGVTIADVTLRNAGYHGVQIRGEAGVSKTQLYNVHVLDAGQQIIKLSAGNTGVGPYGDDGLVACSLIEYSKFSRGSDRSPPSYTNGIDLLAGKGWVVRDNTFRRIRSEAGPAGPAILVWKNSDGTVILRNLIIDSWRGITLGLSPADAYSRGGASVPSDHQNGLVANNVILALREPADAAIENNFAVNSRVLHNTVYYKEGLRHAVNWSIEYRWGPTTAVIRNNLTNLQILKRDPLPGRDAVMGGNLSNAEAKWFVDVMGENVRLAPGAPAIDRGVADPDAGRDLDGKARPAGQAPDVGAYEFGQ